MTKFKVGDLIDVVWNGDHRATVVEVYGNLGCPRYRVEFEGRGCGYPDFSQDSIIGKNSKLVPIEVPTEETYSID
jgi:hypothetical protein